MPATCVISDLPAWGTNVNQISLAVPPMAYRPSKEDMKFIIAIIDYFTKWVEAEALATLIA